MSKLFSSCVLEAFRNSKGVALRSGQPVLKEVNNRFSGMQSLRNLHRDTSDAVLMHWRLEKLRDWIFDYVWLLWKLIGCRRQRRQA